MTRKCLPALKNRNYIGRTSSEKILQPSELSLYLCRSDRLTEFNYLVGYTLEALNSQDPVTGGGKYNAKERKGKGTHPQGNPTARSTI
ncbi:hypothetical protein GN958_ATG14181 [Phytophthora infestans]|uniref:Uncharacterized protein n=1 Tax=Phytophthora infestans TaxID=4787 RepID=A0A8S9UAR0_PHYIN|nr:hypothetical protein GN958_ATG14181 [Phytophthora infestans]